MNYPLTLNQPITIRPSSNLSLQIIRFLSFIIIISLLVFCILQVNLLTQERYLLKNNQIKLKKLSQEIASLEIDFSRVSSLLNLENYLQKQNFEKINPQAISYIQILENEIVKK